MPTPNPDPRRERKRKLYVIESELGLSLVNAPSLADALTYMRTEYGRSGGPYKQAKESVEWCKSLGAKIHEA